MKKFIAVAIMAVASCSAFAFDSTQTAEQVRDEFISRLTETNAESLLAEAQAAFVSNPSVLSTALTLTQTALGTTDRGTALVAAIVASQPATAAGGQTGGGAPPAGDQADSGGQPTGGTGLGGGTTFSTSRSSTVGGGGSSSVSPS